MKHLLLLLLSISAYAQIDVRIAQKNPDTGYQFKMYYTGTNLTTVCKAQSLQPTVQQSIDSATNANPVVFTVSAGHGLNTDARPTVTISGGTGNWTAVNGTHTATPISSTTFSVPVNSTSLGAVTGTLVFTTRAPLLTRSIWSVQYFTYDGSNNQTGAFWYGGSPGAVTTCTAAPTQFQ